MNSPTSYINLMGIGRVTVEFRSLIYVQLASICTGVTLSAFAKWRHC